MHTEVTLVDFPFFFSFAHVLEHSISCSTVIVMNLNKASGLYYHSDCIYMYTYIHCTYVYYLCMRECVHLCVLRESVCMCVCNGHAVCVVNTWCIAVQVRR